MKIRTGGEPSTRATLATEVSEGVWLLLGEGKDYLLEGEVEIGQTRLCTLELDSVNSSSRRHTCACADGACMLKMVV